MKKNRIFRMIPAVALIMTGACSQDVLLSDSNGNSPSLDDDGEGVYMSVNIKMPTADGNTRSFTDDNNSSNSGTEIGSDGENSIKTVYLVLARQSDNKFIAWGEIPQANIVKNSNGTQYNSTAKFSKTDIQKYYDSYVDAASTDRSVNVFVFCNPTIALRNAFEAIEDLSVEDRTTTWVNDICEVNVTDPTAEVIWSDDNFLMTNAEIATRELPATMDDWNYYTEIGKPFNLSNTNPDINVDNSINRGEGSRGPVKVERCAARFDFRDAAPELWNLGQATYPVVYGVKTDADGNEVQGDCYVNIVLNKMSLVNMSKQFYYLRRVSPTGLDNNVTLLGAEEPWFSDDKGTPLPTSGNYVVGPFASAMQGEGITTGFANYFNYPLFNNEGQIDNNVIDGWYTSTIADVLNGRNDNYNPDTKYHVWRYVTENAIPGIDQQQNGQTTGIVFKGKMQATEAALNSKDENVAEVARILNNVGGEVLTGDPAKDPIIYKFLGVKNDVGGMYATWPNVEEAAKRAAITPVWEADNSSEGGYWRLEINRSNSLFHAVFGDGSCGSYTFKDSNGKEWTIPDPVETIDEKAAAYGWHQWQENLNSPDVETYYANFKKAMTSNGFTLYQSSYDGSDGNGYFCYYYYWNRHNDNGKNGIMGPMEFDVIRNNVYKIAVTKISQIGHPRITTNDPTPPTPTTKDEIDDVYISVDVDVLPWVVRVNNVEF